MPAIRSRRARHEACVARPPSGSGGRVSGRVGCYNRLMRVGAISLASLLVASCATHREPPRAASDERRCTLRVSQQGTFVDGEAMSRVDAVAFCKRTAGAMVVIEDDVLCTDWEPTCSALRREGITIAMRGPVGDFRDRPPLAGNAPRTKPPSEKPSEKPVLRCHATCP